MTDLSNYYQDHWVTIEPERMSRYENMFQWRPGHEALIAPAAIELGQTVVDYGCGPGALVAELANRVGATGRVIGLDINAEFLEKTAALARDQQLQGIVDTRQIVDVQLPVDNNAVDRVICKNVLEYVPDPASTIKEFHRILAPGGLAHATDSDWGAVIFEPGGKLFDRVMAAASIAFRTPRIGRKLHGLFNKAQFSQIDVQMLGSPDTVGALKPVLTNMASYARLSETMPDADIQQFLALLDESLADGSYFAVLPQFLVTGTK